MKVVFQPPVVLRLSSPLDSRLVLLATRIIRATLLSVWYYLFMALGASSSVLSFVRPAYWVVGHLGYPVALVGLLLPCDEAPINLWFVQPCADGLSNHHWPSMWQHVRLSIPVYLVLFYLLGAVWAGARRRYTQTRSPAATR